MTAGDKLVFSIISAMTIALLFSMYELYLYSYINIPENIYYVLQMFILTIPMYFFIINSEDGVFGFTTGLFYYLFKYIIVGSLSTVSICLIDMMMFSIAVLIVGLGIGFQKEQTLRNVKLSMLGVFVIMLAYMVSIMMLMVYFTSFSGMMCYPIPHFRIS